MRGVTGVLFRRHIRNIVPPTPLQAFARHQFLRSIIIIICVLWIMLRSFGVVLTITVSIGCLSVPGRKKRYTHLCVILVELIIKW